ncbi:hypothetical protein DPMN_156408 [Dreissena polymorpha]|uniref:Uncharacterized protein n=1 Tax=Dreissena polymorpha TaxID=45954 RepID=A0A9D4JBU4_DREPO|nr:hypothetical protein DPMN_156408 [Dreissena polymorpha]
MIGHKLFLFSQIKRTAALTGGHVFQRIGTTFELNQDIIKTNILTKLHEDWAWNVTSTVFTSFELDRDIIAKNLLTNVYKPNVDDGRTKYGQRPVTKAHLSNQTNRQTNRQGKNNMSPTTIGGRGFLGAKCGGVVVIC